MSVKKEASGRRSVQVEVEVPGSTQSAAERRSAEAELRTLIAKFAPEHLRLIGAMRRSLQKRLPTAHEVVYEYRDWCCRHQLFTERARVRGRSCNPRERGRREAVLQSRQGIAGS